MPQSPQDITVTDLLGRPPGWLLRSGISLIFIVVLLSLVLAAFIQYPDRLTGSLVVQYEQPPVVLSPPINTPIEQLLVENGDSVQEKQALVLFQSDTEWKEVKHIEEILQSPTKRVAQLPDFHNLGSLQSAWSAWVDAQVALNHFKQHNGLLSQLQNLRREQQYTRQLIDILEKRIVSSTRQLDLETNDYKRQHSLAINGVISEQELENKEKAWLGIQNQHRSQEAERVQLELRINSLEQQIAAASLEYENTSFILQQTLEQAQSQLQGRIRNWQTQYVLIAPIAGEVQLPSDVISGQVVAPGSPTLTIMPFIGTKTPLRAQVCLSPSGSGKIKLHDRIIIHLDAWPEAEYGTLITYVDDISPLPEGRTEEQACQIITATLPRPLQTDYGKILTPLPRMTGSATVITAERSLLGKIFEQFRQLLKVTKK